MPTPTIIMVAPNGARKTQQDHPNLPVSIEETVTEAKACFEAGATVLHAHIRGQQNEHVLDAGLYRELIRELGVAVPDMLVQITTEAVGIYTPGQQVDCVKQVRPQMTSISVKEVTQNFKQTDLAKEFYHWSDEQSIHVQHIIYSADELSQFLKLKSRGIVPESQNCVLFVLGRYASNFKSSPDDLLPFLEIDLSSLNWFTCAFGQQEQACVMKGIEQGGHARIGFENNIYLSSGEIATNSAQLVGALKNCIKQSEGTVANTTQARKILGVP